MFRKKWKLASADGSAGQEARAALAIAAVAAGYGFASGRSQAVYAAQLGDCAGLALLSSGIAYGLLIAMVAHLARRTGAFSFPGIYRRLLGIRAGRWIGLLYAAALLAVGGMQLRAAGRMGALMLPLKHGEAGGMLLALFLALLLAAMGERAWIRLGGGYLVLLLGFELALLRWGRAEEPLHFAVKLHLADRPAAALALGLIHASLSAALSAGVVVRLCRQRLHPAALGLRCGALFLLVNLAGCRVLQGQRTEILALQAPFAALISAWGRPGFYLCSGLIALGAVVNLAGCAIALMVAGSEGKTPRKHVKF